MTREKLNALTLDDLKDLSDKFDLDFEDDTDRESLIDTLIEAQEEERQSRTGTNESQVSIEEKKYSILEDGDGEPEQDENYPLPDRYHETYIRILLRDPAWAFAYWEIAENKLKELTGHLNFGGVFLRVYESATLPSFAGEYGTEHFDIPIQPKDMNWYINLPCAEKYYTIEICVKINGKARPLACSKTIWAPNGEFASSKDGSESSKTDALLFLSSTDGVGSCLLAKKIPQRILSVDDSGLFSKNS